MKRLLVTLTLFFLVAYTKGQFIHKIKGDSILITNDSCSAELNLENSTKNVNGFLYNKENGRTEFRKGAIKLTDSTYLFGNEVINFKSFLKNIGISGDFISSLNGITLTTQAFGVGSSGSDFNINSSGGTHTFNLPDASTTNRGVITTTSQTIAGTKTFSAAQIWPSFGLNAIPYIGAGKIILHDSVGLAFNGTDLFMGKNLPGTYTGVYLNNGRGSIQAALAGMRFNIGSGFTGDGTYDASKAYYFQNKGNNYLIIKSDSVSGSIVHNATFYTNLRPNNSGIYNLGQLTNRWKNLFADSVNIGSSGSVLGVLTLSGNTSGSISIKPASAAGSWSLTLPVNSGSSGQILTTDGNGITSWTTTSLDINGLTNETQPDIESDAIPFYDASVSTNRKTNLWRLGASKYIVLSSNVSNSTTTLNSITGFTFTASANAIYEIEIFGAYQSAATTTGIAIALDIPTNASVIGINVTPTNSTTIGGTYQNSDNSTIGASTGVNTANSNTPMHAKFIINAGTSGGTVQATFKSEVASSSVTLQASLTYMKITRIN